MDLALKKLLSVTKCAVDDTNDLENVRSQAMIPTRSGSTPSGEDGNGSPGGL